jgi:NAD(P)-dependent dehydrogenase (short-subunit alcohol dehydrogenase family)
MTSSPVALVTAASQGIGAACARLLAARGYRLALFSRSDKLLPLAKELGAVAVLGDLALEPDLQRFAEAALNRYGRIDAVVLNTGHAAKGDLLNLGDEDWLQGFDLLVLPVIRMVRIAAPVMAGQGQGAFVNISSFAAREPSLAFPISAALRAAVTNYAKIFSQQFAGSGLRMNNVLPGWIDSHPVAEAARQMIPARRPGTPEEVAQATAFLLSDEARYITGQSLLVDGGLVKGV